MKRDNQEVPSSRRAFFRSLFAGSGAVEPQPSEEQKALANRASVLALKYAKNEAKLTKIGVESPVFTGDNLYAVKVSGRDESSKTLQLNLEVDAESGVVRRLDAE